jgi:hypothetical protein
MRCCDEPYLAQLSHSLVMVLAAHQPEIVASDAHPTISEAR